MSSKAYACRPRLARPISISVIWFLPGSTGSAAGVVRRLDRHLDVVRVRLLQPGGSDAHERALVLELLHRPRTAVPHRLAQTADQLVGDGGQRSTVRHLTLDALGDQLVGDGGQRSTVRHLTLDALGDQLLVAADVALEVAVLGVRLAQAAGLHRAERAHPAVRLELLAVDEHQVARRLIAPGEQRTQHHRVRTRHQRLGDVAGVLQAAVADHRYAGRLAGE